MADYYHARPDRPRTPEGRSRFSYDIAERGEPSTIGALLNAPTSPDRPLAFSDDELLPRFNTRSQDAGGRQGGRDRRSRRPHKPQSSGAFLLQNAVANDDDDDYIQPRRRPRQTKGKDLLDPLSSSLPRDYGLGIGSGTGLRPRIVSPDTSTEDLGVKRRTKQHQGSSALDVDSTQIVNMALNLSESRRIASRRNLARANPPRLAPMQDSAPGSNLKAHLQQQRKTSRAISPRPHQALTPRLSGVRSSSPLRPPYEPGHDTPYRYQFSTSTLSRAQKARDHLELMAQYRRLLELLPPLKVGFNRPSTTSPPVSPANALSRSFGASGRGPTLGREYNPLQFIRNRKVRARERRGINGEEQGFSDVESVKLWVGKAAERASSFDLLADGDSILPPFPGCKALDSQTSSETPKSAPRLRRPRVDWSFEPCDMVADAYWVEQDHHKQLIEDRHWCKIFPQTAELTRPMSRQTDEPGTGSSPFAPLTQENTEGDPKEHRLSRPDTDNSQGSSTRVRAKQKLHEIGGGIHRHTPSSHSHHDFLRMRRDSDSSLSGSDEAIYEGITRRTRPTRSATLSSNTNDLLEKQMLEMIAREAKEQLSQVPEDQAEYSQPKSSITPERVPLSNPSSHRKGSLTDPSDSDHRSIRGKARRDPLPRNQAGRPEYLLPNARERDSADIDSPQPMSPELVPQDNLYAAPTNLDLSVPSSRSSSPSRNPFTKVKQIFRDKGREDVEPQGEEPEIASGRPSISEPLSPVESRTLELRRTNSRPIEGHRHQRSTASARLRGDESIGLRGMFKGPRIDTVIRGGVSRLGDMLWRKESAPDTPVDALSTDESDTEPAKGRTRLSLTISRTGSKRDRNEPQPAPKHFLDTMPQFQHVSELHSKPGGNNTSKQDADLSRTQSHLSARIDLLKPPKLDVQNPTTGSSTPSTKPGRYADVEYSETESTHESSSDAIKPKKMVDFVLDLPGSDIRGRPLSRHWSIADHAPPQENQLSRRDIARLRALILTSGIKAMEICRRAQELKRPLSEGTLRHPGKNAKSSVPGIPWPEISDMAPFHALPPDGLVATCDHLPLASRSLDLTIQTSLQRWQVSADRFTKQTRPHLEKRIWRIRSRIMDDLSGMTGEAADHADEIGKDLALGQRLKVKHVVDIIDTMMRSRRRRFRWVRRGMWVVVEWILVGFMWYVWFVVMLFRVVLGLGQGVWGGVKWLLWL